MVGEHKSKGGLIDDSQFIRYQRQVALTEIGEQGQARLQRARVLIVGCGGLGCCVAQYLTGAGIGSLVLADGDQVELSNLHRQIVYKEKEIGCNKAKALVGQLSELNRDVRLRPVVAVLEGQRLDLEVMMADLVIDCTDNYRARYAINRACFGAATPLLSGAAIGWSGYIADFHVSAGTPCYHCVFPQQSTTRDGENCTSSGVVGPIVGAVGSMLALAAIKQLVGINLENHSVLYRLDGLTMQWSELALMKSPRCPVCGTGSEQSNCVSGESSSAGKNRENQQ